MAQKLIVDLWLPYLHTIITLKISTSLEILHMENLPKFDFPKANVKKFLNFNHNYLVKIISIFCTHGF